MRRSEPILLVHLKSKQVAPITSGGNRTIPAQRAAHKLSLLQAADAELVQASKTPATTTVGQLAGILATLKTATGNHAFDRYSSIQNARSAIAFEVRLAQVAIVTGTTPISVVQQPQPDPVDISSSIVGFDYEDDEKKTDMLTLSISNQDLSYFDTPLFDKGTTMVVSWGYPGAMSPPREVVVQTIKGSRTLTVEAHGKAVLMNKEAKVRTFENVTRAEVVRQIAQENGYGPEKQDIDNAPAPDLTVRQLQSQLAAAKDALLGPAIGMSVTQARGLEARFVSLQAQLVAAQKASATSAQQSPSSAIRYPTISQSGLTDAQFLKRLADLQGFEFYVDFDGLHWHPRRVGQKPLKKLVYYLPQPDAGSILDFSVESDLTAKPGQVTAKGRDPIAKTDISSTSNNADTPRDTMAPVIEIFDKASGASSLREQTGSATVTTTAEPTAAAASKETAQAFVRTQQAATLLQLDLVGDPDFLAKTVVEVSGLGKRLSGKYYVSSVKHSIQPGKVYTMTAKLRSDGTNAGTLLPGAGTLNDQKAPGTPPGTGNDPPALTAIDVVDRASGALTTTYTDTRGRGTDGAPKGG